MQLPSDDVSYFLDSQASKTGSQIELKQRNLREFSLCSDYYPVSLDEKNKRAQSANIGQSSQQKSLEREQRTRSRFSAFQKAAEWSEGIPPESLRSFFRTFRKPVELRWPDQKELLEQQTRKISEFTRNKESLHTVSKSLKLRKTIVYLNIKEDEFNQGYFRDATNVQLDFHDISKIIEESASEYDDSSREYSQPNERSTA